MFSRIDILKRSIEIVKSLHTRSASFESCALEVKELAGACGDLFSEKVILRLLPVLIEYFYYPTRSVSKIRRAYQHMCVEQIIEAHRVMRESFWVQHLFTSFYYPRQLLLIAAKKLVSFMDRRPEYVDRLVSRQLTGPMMLEIHPTNAKCNYRCNMCLWCGGNDISLLKQGLYKDSRFLTIEQWSQVLEDAKQLGVQQVVFSGGGEPLLAEDKLQPLLKKAKNLGLEVMVYTNGSTLSQVSPVLLSSLLDATWLRVSLHAASPDIYAMLVNRSFKHGDFDRVVNGIRNLVEIRNREGFVVQIGAGIVLQNVNYSEIPALVDLCVSLKIDFLDIRADCVGISESLSCEQHADMFRDLRQLRENCQIGNIPFRVTFADDLLIAMDQWDDMDIPAPQHCMIPVIRPAIDPFGVVGACCSIGEPYIRAKSPPEYVLGCVSDGTSFVDVMRSASAKRLGVQCGYCMPGQVALNALVQKLLDDVANGIMPTDQYFNFQR